MDVPIMLSTKGFIIKLFMGFVSSLLTLQVLFATWFILAGNIPIAFTFKDELFLYLLLLQAVIMAFACFAYNEVYWQANHTAFALRMLTVIVALLDILSFPSMAYPVIGAAYRLLIVEIIVMGLLIALDLFLITRHYNAWINYPANQKDDRQAVILLLLNICS